VKLLGAIAILGLLSIVALTLITRPDRPQRPPASETRPRPHAAPSAAVTTRTTELPPAREILDDSVAQSDPDPSPPAVTEPAPAPVPAADPRDLLDQWPEGHLVNVEAGPGIVTIPADATFDQLKNFVERVHDRCVEYSLTGTNGKTSAQITSICWSFAEFCWVQADLVWPGRDEPVKREPPWNQRAR